MKLQKDLCELIELLNSQRVKYVIVGWYAVAFHGYARHSLFAIRHSLFAMCY
ncbi:MAG: hypothetical protein JXQ75_16550 [Phycisphaerae bacterium]|nr:hypothetical protein [Phycisphaerae bacterium]